MVVDRVLVDTGPLVAMLRRNDAEHARCIAAVRSMRTPLLTSVAVLTEACWLLRDLPSAVSQLLLEVEQSVVQPLDLDHNAYPWLRSFFSKYQDLRPQFADATLCYLAEREKIEVIFTLDRRDFQVYRDSRGKPFRLAPE